MNNDRSSRYQLDHCFAYLYSSEVNVPVRVRVVSLYGFLPNPQHMPSGCMYLKIAVYCNGKRVAGRDVQTSFRASTLYNGPNRDIQKWNEWCTLPIRYSELSRDALLHITLWDCGENSIKPVFIAQCWKTLFSKHGVCRSGQFDLRMETSPDASPLIETSGLCHQQRKTSSKPRGEVAELLKKEKLYKQNFIDRVNWLDKITFSRLEEIKHEVKTEDRSLYLTLETPTVHYANDSFAYSIVFFAEDDDFLNSSSTTAINNRSMNFNAIPAPNYRTTANGDKHWVDPELGLDNLCEIKHHMLTRNARANHIDRRLQPNSSARGAIETIIAAPSSQALSVEERDLIWKFRFWLRTNPRALTKFVRSVNWDEELEVRQAIQAMLEWEPIDACDALELLAPSFTHPFVRRYAVSRLTQQTSYANILLYLPQLVQALRYETKADTTDALLVAKDTTSNSIIEVSMKGGASADATILPNKGTLEDGNVSSSSMVEYFGSSDTDLASFLVRAACENSVIANFFYWYLKVEIEATAEIDEHISHMFAKVMEKLKAALAKGNSLSRQTLATLSHQKKFVDTLVDMAKFAAEVSGSRAKKLEVLKKKLAENHDLMDLKGLSLPLDPSIHVKNIHAESTILFSSNLMPMRLTFSTVRGSVTPYECGEAYTTIFKRGDDLRQDQLVIQMIRLMDSLLKEEKLDLCLTPYAVLATSVTEGFVQFVKATPLADLKSIQETLRTFRPSSSGPFGIETDVLNNYVRSCAGYSIVCYILGIGDRHLHNLLLCENGRMFHVDFGFILGRDPKPLPPSMKLTSEMINAMGGQNSEYFKDFVDYCTTAFCILRRHANLITNLFSLMLDAGIPDIAVEKDKAVQKVLERFHLHLTDEGACQLVHKLIETKMSYSRIVTQSIRRTASSSNKNPAIYPPPSKVKTSTDVQRNQVKSSSERALDYVSKASRVKLHDLRDNPGARVDGRQVSKAHNQAGHTLGELERAAKPPLGWIWGNFYLPWQRKFPGEKHFNGDVNLRREYIPLSLLELQRMIDLGYLDSGKLIDICALCSTNLIKVKPELRQFGIHLTDEGSEIFAAKINLEVQWASVTSIAAVEKAGGRIRTAYYDLASLKAAVNAEKWFQTGQPIPARKYPPHSLMHYYTNPVYRGYLSDNEMMETSAHRLAEIVGYEWKPPKDDVNHEEKKPTQVFLGLDAGSLVSLADEKVYEPSHASVLEYYRPEEPLADHLR
ncbi:phosphoinositide 3-kinase family, accessory domain (PIK domain) domain-containing protein [Ditylenchus destructor]|nr:phosphoinositide 3-kinase family, accessory domain (PIK domain) domain-containing protein [Ditylenchus destructor]